MRLICTVFLLCTESGWLQENTQHPSAIAKIRALETPKVRGETEVEPVYDHPTFTRHLNNVQLTEKGTAVFECQVEPSRDPALHIGNQELFTLKCCHVLVNVRLGTEWAAFTEWLKVHTEPRLWLRPPGD